MCTLSLHQKYSLEVARETVPQFGGAREMVKVTHTRPTVIPTEHKEVSSQLTS